jgi:hypothetical protein
LEEDILKILADKTYPLKLRPEGEKEILREIDKLAGSELSK